MMRPQTIKDINNEFEIERKNKLKVLRQELDQPFIVNKHQNKRAVDDGDGEPKKKRRFKRDYLRRIFRTNREVFAKYQAQNEKIQMMLKKLDLDKPILMNDKLDAIWVENELVPGKKEFNSKNNNYVEVQRKLKSIKSKRTA